jgi:hypothetical protein
MAASQPERRRLLDTLTTSGAISPETAMTRYELVAERSRPLDRLVRQGLVATTSDGRFYVVEARVPDERRRLRWITTLTGVVASAAGILAIWLLWR